MTRVLIVASPLTRAGLESLLRSAPDLEVVTAEPDVIVSDAEDASQELLDSAPGAALLLLADNPQHDWTVEALRSGVRGVLPRDAVPAQILAAIEAAAAGLVVLQAEEVETVLVPPRPARMTEPLSRRELEVLAMLAEGQSNKAIAYRLSISEHTVKFHVNSIMTKLNAGSRTEAVTLGLRQGLILL